MKTKNLWLVWLYVFGFSCVFGFIPNPQGLVKALLVLLAVGFFLPGGLLVNRGGRKTLGWILFISAASLVLTTVSVILNFASALMEPVWGTVLYILMGIVSTPMLCSQIWVVSLFGWACLLVTSILKLSKKPE